MNMTLQAGVFDIDFWKKEPPDGIIDLICFIPNGMVLQLSMPSTSTIHSIKTEIVKQAKISPLNHVIKDACDYELRGLTKFANMDTFTDEKKRLCDVMPYFCLLTLNERSKASAISSDYELIKMVSDTIGKSYDVYNEEKSTPEIKEFRIKMAQLCEEIELQRSKFTWQQKLEWEHPMRLANTPKIPEILRNRLHNSTSFFIVVKWENNDTQYTIPANESTTVSAIIVVTLDKLNRAHMKISNRLSDYVLKVVGREEYLFGDIPLVQFIFIQEVLSGKHVPNVELKHIHSISSYKSYLDMKRQEQPIISNNSIKDTGQRFTPVQKTTWDLNEKFRLHLHSVVKLNFDRSRAIKIGVRMGLYHGEKKLCTHPSLVMEVGTEDCIKFDKEISFDIELRNLPRMARLCIAIYEITKLSRPKKSSNTNKKDNISASPNETENPLAWVNMTVFDYKNQLRSTELSLYAWTYAEGLQTDEILNPLGTIEPNPEVNQCAVVTLKIQSYGYEALYYPPEKVILQYAEELSKPDQSKPKNKTLREVIQQCSGAVQHYELHDQDRNDIWGLRYEFRDSEPAELSLLLRVVNWNDRNDVAELWSLLKKWPTIPVERSLKLLDYAYPDPAVRSFATRCLGLLKDEELLLYLLQLVQAIKHESYIDCDLVKFILERVLRNQRIGHYFFWHLRSEMQTPAVQTRFGLLLEAYLKGSKPHIPLLRKQLNALATLKLGSEIAKKGSKEKVRMALQNFLSNVIHSKCLKNIKNPLNPSFRCRGVKPEKCKVMDSKMRPLWIVFENTDDIQNDIYIIFKNGDDLRQDMLTLQMLRVMDQLWKNEGLDLRMNVYNCISMERCMGMIEVVLNAETIANIQKEKGMFSATSPFKKGSLYSWLKEFNKTEEELNKAVMEFTLSCAGYCVATYVLGVADRHSDNIMVKRNGQLFHIDFGHILGHFKEKFGVRRERVPFVLTHDFVYVISKGRADRESEQFLHFENICQQAFLILRKHGCLILSLFSMMISTGLPELSSGKDLNYLKDTLVLDVSEETAREHIKSKISEALTNSWKTSLNWASHNFSKNNKQ